VEGRVHRPTAAAHRDGSPTLPFVRRLCYALSCSVLEFIQDDGWPRDDFEERLMFWIRKNGFASLNKFEKHFVLMYALRGDDILRRYIKYMHQTERFRLDEKKNQQQYKFGEES